MNYTTEDAVTLRNTILTDIEHHGGDAVFANLKHVDPELLALTVMLSALS